MTPEQESAERVNKAVKLFMQIEAMIRQKNALLNAMTTGERAEYIRRIG